MFAEQISDMIEEEVQRRLSGYIKTFADHFFTTEADLYKVINSKSSVSYCKGKSRNGKSCKNKGKPEHDGFCHLHKGQRPKQKHQRTPRDNPHPKSTDEQIRSSSGIVDEIF